MLDQVIYWFYFLLWSWLFEPRFKNRTRDLKNVKKYYAKASFEDWLQESIGKRNDRLVLSGTTQDNDLIHIDLTFSKHGRVRGRLLLKIGEEIYTCPELKGQACLSADGICTVISVGPLRLEVRDPFKKWRVTIRGSLTSKSGKKHFVKVLGWFKATSDEYYLLSSLTLQELSASSAIDFSATKALQGRSDYIQWGLFQSRIIVDDNEPIVANFRLVKVSTLGRNAEENVLVNEIYFLNSEFGDRLIWVRLGYPESSKTLKIGRVFGSDHTIAAVEDASFPETASRAQSNFKFNDFPDLHIASSTVDWDKQLCHAVEVQIKSIQDLRMSISYSENLEDDTVATNALEGYQASRDEKEKLVLPLGHRAAQDSNISGGKGANLAKLCTLQTDFTVPSGVVVTVTAFNRHLQAHQNIRQLMDKMKDSAFLDEEAINKFEAAMNAAFESTQLSATLLKEVENQLQRVLGSADMENALFAVRSSAVGEDGSELSSAGQLETYLNVKSTEIADRVVKCWASNYRKEIVTYRVQNGQVLDPPVAVVVQRLIFGGQSGVMFTNDPVKGNPEEVVINVVEGLGEALVGGQATPDQIVVSKQLKILSKPPQCSLPDQMSIKLAKLGLLLENCFGKPQDVEFAVKNEEIYILQSRDITSLDLETDWELEHEFDTPTICDKDIISTANVGEVMPRPFTPLGDSLVVDLYDRCVNLMVLEANGSQAPLFKHVRIGFPTYRQRVFLSLSEMYLHNWMSIEKDRTSEYSLAGQKIFTKEMIEIGSRRFGLTHQRSEGKSLFNMLKTMIFLMRSYVKNIEKTMEKLKKLEAKKMSSFEEQLDRLEQTRDYLGTLVKCHSGISMFSSFTYVLVAIFARGSPEGDLSPEVLADIATIYAENPLKAISADVPKALKNLAMAMLAEDRVEPFQAETEPRAAWQYLMEQGGSTGENARRIMEIHGHRGVSELLLHGESWRQNPIQLVMNIKSILVSIKDSQGYQQVDEQVHTTDEIIDKLKHVKVEGIKRKLFKFFINQAHKGVYLREKAKSDLVYATLSLRTAVLELGNMLKSKGYLADAHGILFMTFEEIKDLISTRNPRILQRMRRRTRIFDKQLEQEYNFVNIGEPLPRNQSNMKQFKADVELKGTSVCEGVVVGTARVAKSLDEALTTVPGEILITRYTDIGWSPLFPIISGLVTEIGGLLSHGSVVAREYGLPCIIAVDEATDVFRTGDQVMLDANRGTIKRIKAEQ